MRELVGSKNTIGQMASVLKKLQKATFYVSNHTLHFDLRIPYVYMAFPRTDSYPSHDPGLTPQLPHATTSAPAEQQAFKKKMDI